MRHLAHLTRIASTLVAMLPLAATAAWSADEPAVELTSGLQAVSIDADDDRDGYFNRGRDEEGGFTLDELLTYWSSEGSFALLEASDVLQGDERYRLEAGFAGLRIEGSFVRTPWSNGSQARSVLDSAQPGVFRFADVAQRALEDPDGNGVPFYTEPGGLANGDNFLVQGFTRDLLASVDALELDVRRSTALVSLSNGIGPRFRYEFALRQDRERGLQPVGNGTYQRVTDGYDYLFSVRGVELAAPLATETDTFSGFFELADDDWFTRFTATYSEFDNDWSTLTYDNPFWFTDVRATSGSRRGLWEQAQTTQAPSNEALTLGLTGGISLPARTNLRASVRWGEQTQNDPFDPITLNSALIGDLDLNGDGIADEADDPTSLSALPKRSLDAKAETLSTNISLSSRPNDRLHLQAAWNYYDYDGGRPSFTLPGRADYNDSRLQPDFHHADLIYIPYQYSRERLSVDVGIQSAPGLVVTPYAKAISRERPQYIDFDGGSTFDRDAGVRAVENTDEDIFGVKAAWRRERFALRLDLQQSERRFDGDYQVGFDGELEELRQYDIANRDRDQAEVEVEIFPTEAVTFGIGYRTAEDEYADSLYGLIDGGEDAIRANLSVAFGDSSDLYVWAERVETDYRMHLRTKCSNCPPPEGAAWTAPWNVPNFDWFTDIDDETLAVGAGLDAASKGNRLEIEVSWVEGTVAQQNRNPDVPRDFLRGGAPVQVALAVDFPDQSTELVSLEATWSRELSKHFKCGIRYLYEEWHLDDFQSEVGAYGPDSLTVDDSTRWLFLGGFFDDYEVHVGQVFLRLSL